MNKINQIFSGDAKRKRSSYFEKEKRNVDYCEICRKSFKQLIVRKHKCKRCKRYICSQCGQNKTLIIGIDIEKNIPHRTCDFCIFDQCFLKEFLQMNKLKWSTSSPISAKWLGFIVLQKEHTISYSQCLSYFEKNPENYADDYEIILKDIDDGRTDYELWNYSMRDFLYDLQKDIPKEKIKSNCKNVLKALIIKFPDIGYCQGMNYIITFLLCFASEEETFDLFAFAVENILPPKFFQSNEKGDGLLGVLAEKHALSFFLHDFLENNDPDILYSANQILELKSVNWLLCLLINYLDFKSTYFLWDNMFRDSSIIEIDKAILLIVANQINYLSDPNYDSNLLNDSIVRNITLDLLKKNAKNSLDPVLKKKYFDEFIKNISEKWRKQEPIIFHQLEKITHFSKDEIKEIQNEFIKYLEENYKSDKKSEVIGIYKSDFVKIMTAIQENKLLQDKAFFKLNPSNLDRIFEIFDSDKSGSLDFKEFLCCISLFMRGQIKEKMELCFWLFDHDHKGFLNSEEIDSFLCTLFKAIMISYTKEEANLYSIQFSDFKKRIFKEYCTNGTMNFTDLNEIIKDPFIFELSSHYRGLIRKNTSTQVAATINQNILFSIDENQKK